jgi:hypothetical protein
VRLRGLASEQRGLVVVAHAPLDHATPFDIRLVSHIGCHLFIFKDALGNTTENNKVLHSVIFQHVYMRIVEWTVSSKVAPHGACTLV